MFLSELRGTTRRGRHHLHTSANMLLSEKARQAKDESPVKPHRLPADAKPQLMVVALGHNKPGVYRVYRLPCTFIHMSSTTYIRTRGYYLSLLCMDANRITRKTVYRCKLLSRCDDDLFPGTLHPVTDVIRSHGASIMVCTHSQ